MTLDASQGLVHLKSPRSVPDTILRLADLVRAKGLTLLAKIDHSGDAAKVGLRMNPTELLIFGSPKAGTPLMMAAPTLAIDLPLKALAWQDSDGSVWLTYNSTSYLAERHGIPDELLSNIAGIQALCESAVQS
ncbi:uncharacterized protein (DUF302 family) [Silvibacterium bohemicum]|uniref:Uncharacterized protein (DUF302 family) n=1 Tax=Silvibacterium bohemicum TaxID=1577686 RepID=A0A841JZS2_9BACT|nr:DUF302 domain-containing protein [Silvibacterium bohemicum]MBB6144461.1 uncharacterized protein (DUF302 family) [Silvibacterium bohemicum]